MTKETPSSKPSETGLRENLGFSPDIWWTQLVHDLEENNRRQEELLATIKQRVTEAGAAEITTEEAEILRRARVEIANLSRLLGDAFTFFNRGGKRPEKMN
ncbi:MAG: hypothetical protein WC310_01800 [Patescibacteria group bacterium]|jgi:nucleotide-binding universal stress UspA family protein